MGNPIPGLSLVPPGSLPLTRSLSLTCFLRQFFWSKALIVNVVFTKPTWFKA